MADILMLIENNFEDTEAMYPYYRMREAGHRVIVVGPRAATYHSKYGYPLNAEKSPSDVKARDFKCLIIPGGGAPDRMRLNLQMVSLVKDAVKEGLIVGAICHGPQMLMEAGVLKGKRATCYASIKTDLVNAGALYEDSPVVADGNLVTSRHPDDLPQFLKKLLGMLG